MGYIEENLMGRETVVYQANIHWIIFAPSVVFFVLGILMMGIGFGSATNSDSPVFLVAIFGVPMVLVAPFAFVGAFIKKKTTELGITNKRVIAKFGLVRRNTVELNHNKVESFSVDQSIAGRIFGYGTVTLQGTGGGKTPIKGIESPMRFRQEAMEVIDKSGLNNDK